MIYRSHRLQSIRTNDREKGGRSVRSFAITYQKSFEI